MAQFYYEGKARKGECRKGNVTANSRREAMLELREKGIAVIEIQEVQVSFLQREITIGNPVKLQDLVITFTHNPPSEGCSLLLSFKGLIP